MDNKGKMKVISKDEKMKVISDSKESFRRRAIMRSGQGSMTVQILAKGKTNYLRI